MRSIFSVLLAIICIADVSAQEQVQQTPLPKQHKNELGLLIEPGRADVRYGSPSGIQYKRWVKPNYGYHISVTTGNYSYDSEPYFDDKIGDSTFFYQSVTFVPMHYLGGGVQVQKKFWGKLYLYAAIETRVGYGKGHTTEMRTKQVFVADTPLVRSFDAQTTFQDKLSIWVLDTTPVLGARFAIRRFSVSAEITAIKYGVTDGRFEQMNWLNGASPILEIGRLRQRFNLSYRF